MPGYGRRGRSSASKSRRTVRGYTLRGRNGRLAYVGVTNNPGRRAAEHRQDGKRGGMKVETRPMSREAARRWKACRSPSISRRKESTPEQDSEWWVECLITSHQGLQGTTIWTTGNSNV